jgi:hypothetical protein
MVKTAKVKTDLQVRAALRASEERRLDHACNTLIELVNKHAIHDIEREYDCAEINKLQVRLQAAIKNQHVRDRAIAARRITATHGDY